MRLQGYQRSGLLAMFMAVAAAAITNGPTTDLHRRAPEAAKHQLVAATRTSFLKPRDTELQLARSLDLHYADVGSGIRSNYAALVHLESKDHILLLEDNEHLFSAVECSPGLLMLTISATGNGNFKETLDDLVGGHVITSHASCNEDTERKPHKVTAVSCADDGTASLSLGTATWRDFRRFSLNMVDADSSYIARPHRDLRRRQIATSTIAPEVAASLSTALSQATVTVENPTFSLANSVIDFGFPEAPLNLRCSNCSSFGDVDLDFTNFSWDCDAEDSDSEIRCLQGGELAGTFTGVGAYIELGITLANSSDDNVIDEFSLWEIQSPFNILLSGIGTIGLIYSLSIGYEYSFNEPVDLTFGFEAYLPETASFFADISDPSNSSSTPFTPTFSSITPQSNVSISGLSFEVALRHRWSLAFNVSGVVDNLDLEAGLMLELPRFNGTVDLVNNVGPDCRPLNASGLSSEDRDLAGTVLSSAVALDADVGFGFFFFGDAILIDEFDFELYESTFPAENTLCLAFDANSTTYTPAQEVFDAAVAARDAENTDGNGEGGDAQGAADTLEAHSKGMFVALMLAVGCLML